MAIITKKYWPITATFETHPLYVPRIFQESSLAMRCDDKEVHEEGSSHTLRL